MMEKTINIKLEIFWPKKEILDPLQVEIWKLCKKEKVASRAFFNLVSFSEQISLSERKDKSSLVVFHQESIWTIVFKVFQDRAGQYFIIKVAHIHSHLCCWVWSWIVSCEKTTIANFAAQRRIKMHKNNGSWRQDLQTWCVFNPIYEHGRGKRGVKNNVWSLVGGGGGGMAPNTVSTFACREGMGLLLYFKCKKVVQSSLVENRCTSEHFVCRNRGAS